MYIVYNGLLYHLIEKSLFFDEKAAISTHFKEKTDETFIGVSDYYAKELNPSDSKIQDIFDVDYFVVYNDKSETVKKKSEDLNAEIKRGEHVGEDERNAVFRHIWNADGGAPILNPPSIADNEVEIILGGKSCSQDWIEFERGWCYKAVNIFDCEKLIVRYTYSVRGGKKLPKKEVVEVTVSPKVFKTEKLKYGLRNI